MRELGCVVNTQLPALKVWTVDGGPYSLSISGSVPGWCTSVLSDGKGGNGWRWEIGLMIAAGFYYLPELPVGARLG